MKITNYTLIGMILCACFFVNCKSEQNPNQAAKTAEANTNETTQTLVPIDSTKNPFLNPAWPIADPIASKVKKSSKIYAPYYKDYKYFIANANGSPISKNRYNDIQMDKNHPFYWIKKDDGGYYLHTFPEEQVLVDKFEGPQEITFARSSLIFPPNMASDYTYYAIRTEGPVRTFRPWYLFTQATRNAKKSKYAPITWYHEMGCGDKIKSTSTQSPYAKYLLVIDEDCKFRIIDKNAQLVIKTAFDDFDRFFHSDNHVLMTQGDKDGVFNYNDKSYTPFNYKNIKYIEDSDGLFSAHYLEDEKNTEKLILNDKGKVVFSHTNGNREVHEGHITVSSDDEYKLYNILENKKIASFDRKKYEYVKIIRMYKGKGYAVMYDSTVLNLKGDTLDTAPWFTDIRTKSIQIKNRLHKEYPNAKTIKVSPILSGKYYKVELDQLNGLLNPDGSIAISFYEMKLFSMENHLTLPNYLKLMKGGSEVQLSTDLEIIFYNTNIDNKRISFDIDDIELSMQGKNGIRFVGPPNRITGHLYYQDEQYTHIVTRSGDYIGSYEGTFSKQLTHYQLTGEFVKDSQAGDFVELRHLRNKQFKNNKYYVRLSDGKAFYEPS